MNWSLYWAKSSAADTLALLRTVSADARRATLLLAGDRLPSQGLVRPCAYATCWPSGPSGKTDGQKKAVETLIYYKNRLYCRGGEGRQLRWYRSSTYGRTPKTSSHGPRGGRTAS